MILVREVIFSGEWCCGIELGLNCKKPLSLFAVGFQEVLDSTVVAGAIVTFKLLGDRDLFLTSVFFMSHLLPPVVSHDQGFVFC